MLNRIALPCLLAAAVVTSGCAFEDDTAWDTPPEEDLERADSESLVIGALGLVDLDAMVQNIRDDLNGDVVGYGFAINRNGVRVKAGSWGLAQRPIDGRMSMWSARKMQVASVSKTLAAVATLKLLEELELGVDTRIAPWLPSSWSKGAGWNNVTFRHILSHTSGVKQLWNAMTADQRKPWTNNWDGLRYVVSRGVKPGSSYGYKNANYALLRILIPSLWKAAPSGPSIPFIGKTSYAFWHLAYMQQYVFEPAGIEGAACWEQSGETTAYLYDINDPDESGSPANLSFESCGAHSGWHLSARDLAALMAKMRWDRGYFSRANRDLMDNGRLGWSRTSDTNSGGRAGKFWHGGAWYPGGDRAGRSCVMKFPDGVEASLLVNSEPTKGPCGVLKDAFNNAL